jgi:hypothetical protein
MLPDPTIHHDFSELLPLSREELVRELLVCASDLANMSTRIGFLKAEEIRDPKSYAKQERVELECIRTAYEEKRWILIRLIETPLPNAR